MMRCKDENIQCIDATIKRSRNMKISKTNQDTYKTDSKRYDIHARVIQKRKLDEEICYLLKIHF
jgi:hypothetical protein